MNLLISLLMVVAGNPLGLAGLVVTIIPGMGKGATRGYAARLMFPDREDWLDRFGWAFFWFVPKAAKPPWAQQQEAGLQQQPWYYEDGHCDQGFDNMLIQLARHCPTEAILAGVTRVPSLHQPRFLRAHQLVHITSPLDFAGDGRANEDV